MALDWNYFPEHFLKSAVIPLEQTSKIPGNGSAETKHWVANVLLYLNYTGKKFSNSIGNRVEIVEISINHKSEDPMRLEGRVVCEIETQEGTNA
jgi:acyl-coenzyme A thioesterase 13